MCKSCRINEGPEMWVTADGAIVGAWGLAAEVAVSDDNEQPPS